MLMLAAVFIRAGQPRTLSRPQTKTSICDRHAQRPIEREYARIAVRKHLDFFPTFLSPCIQQSWRRHRASTILNPKLIRADRTLGLWDGVQRKADSSSGTSSYSDVSLSDSDGNLRESFNISRFVIPAPSIQAASPPPWARDSQTLSPPPRHIGTHEFQKAVQPGSPSLRCSAPCNSRS
jgi:hypothetical protein